MLGNLNYCLSLNNSLNCKSADIFVDENGGKIICKECDQPFGILTKLN